ncbi:putative metalloprotease CJM1_0395 family protein [Thalassospira mesophila]|uniref:putative metalloprotease CJM1_0395 family protein n=1 Tax=Thalassospira mesophila TaxID=1293891 RepID=UPI001FE61DEE|nr:putative metalloprotease CJM1_0395 family protein [Thalassospira mesophila]
MIAIGSIQTIPGSGGKIGEVIAMNGLARADSQGASSGGASQGGLLPRRMAAVSLVPITSPASKQLPAASSGPSQNAGSRVGATNTTDQTASAPAPSASPAPARPAPAISAATVTVVQQVDPRSLPGGGTTTIDLPDSTVDTDTSTSASTSQTNAPDGAPETLSAGAQDQVRRLQDRDATVRAEENSHKALAGANAGMISYQYAVGPDGRLYAEGGHVAIQPLGGLTGLQAIANQAAIGSAASIGTSAADFSAAQGASGAISHMMALDSAIASKSYQKTAITTTAQREASLNITS